MPSPLKFFYFAGLFIIWFLFPLASRTDHGERHAGFRELPLTAKIFRIPASSKNLLLLNNYDFLKTNGYIFDEWVRNSFDLSFDSQGRLFGTENSNDRDHPEELNWLREGHHYGFPWVIGGVDNPTRTSGYTNLNDPFLSRQATAYDFHYYDPSFPPAPDNMMPGIVNIGPDADFFRDSNGQIANASINGTSFPLSLRTGPRLDLCSITPPPWVHRTPETVLFSVGQELRAHSFRDFLTLEKI